MAKRILLILLAVLVVAGAVIGGVIYVGTQSDGEREGSAHLSGTSGADTEQDDDFGTVEVYAVLDDGTLDPEASGLTEKVWDTFVRVVTPDFAATTMTQFRVGDAPDSDTLAYVYQDDDPQYWVLAANLATSENEADLIATLVHEYSHILSLGGSEMDASVDSCSTIELTEGCAAGDSHLWGFEQQFWAGYGDESPSADNDDENEAYDFYLAHEEDFVSDYAATNVVEDFAESFMTFVLEEQPDADTLVADKLNYFWQFEEFTGIRERIRDEFSDELGLGV